MTTPSKTHSQSRKARSKHSFIQLLAMAIQDSPNKKLTLKEIYQFLMEKHQFSPEDEKRWQNRVRSTLSAYDYFVKVRRAAGRGSFWELHPDYKEMVSPYQHFTSNSVSAETEPKIQTQTNLIVNSLICKAIQQSPRKMLTLSEIYQCLAETEHSLEPNDLSWQCYVRRALTENKDCFVKVEKPSLEPAGSGCFWAIRPEFNNHLCRGSLIEAEKHKHIQELTVNHVEKSAINFKVDAMLDVEAILQEQEFPVADFAMTINSASSPRSEFQQQMQTSELSFYDDDANYTFWFDS